MSNFRTKNALARIVASGNPYALSAFLASPRSLKSFHIDDQDENGNTLLMDVCKAKNEMCLWEVLAYQPNLNLQNNAGDTALHILAKATHTYVMIEKLVLLGACLDIQNQKNQTPLLLSCLCAIQLIHSLDPRA